MKIASWKGENNHSKMSKGIEIYLPCKMGDYLYFKAQMTWYCLLVHKITGKQNN